MDHVASAKGVHTRTARVRRASARTEAERINRQLDVVDLIVSGATVRQAANTFHVSMENIREDYAAGLDLLRDKGRDYSLQLRDEVTARQRSIIMANITRARSGDKAAAIIVNQADNLLASIWGLKYIKIERTPRGAGDAGIASALEGYLAGLEQSSAPVPTKPRP